MNEEDYEITDEENSANHDVEMTDSHPRKAKGKNGRKNQRFIYERVN